MNSKKKKKKKISIRKIVIFVAVLVFAILFFYKLFNTRITNIYVKGNVIFTDQEIIDIAGIKNHPISIKNNFFVIEKRLNKNKYILSSYVYKKGLLSKVYIEIKENYPLFYDLVNNETILFDGKITDDLFVVPTLINQVPDTIYKKFMEKIKDIDISILYKISEIKYEPNEVDDRLFLLLMNDGNYVYVSLNTFNKLNKYYEIISPFNDKKCVLHLDSGNNVNCNEE